jgi:hypothetical protein
MAITIEAARRVVLAARKTGRLVQVGRQHRSNPRYHTALEYIYKKKAIGRITSVYAQWHGHKRVPYKWPESQTIPAETLRRYGFESMTQHRNWRWFAKFSAGEIVNLAAHQIDVFNWFLRAPPKGVMASGGLDFYDFFELYDNVVCFFEWDFTWEGRTKTVRGAHRTLTYTDTGGFYEAFLGDEGGLGISEDTAKGGLYRQGESATTTWENGLKPVILVGCSITCSMGRAILPLSDWLDYGIVPTCHHFYAHAASSHPLRLYPLVFSAPDDKHPHWYHLKNFFDAMRGEAKLTCPAEIGFQTCVSALKAVEAMKTGRRIELAPQDFVVE